MAGKARQFGLLLWKNYVLQKRKKLVTFVEIALPTFFAVILIFIRMSMKILELHELLLLQKCKMKLIIYLTYCLVRYNSIENKNCIAFI